MLNQSSLFNFLIQCQSVLLVVSNDSQATFDPGPNDSFACFLRVLSMLLSSFICTKRRPPFAEEFKGGHLYDEIVRFRTRD